MINKLEDNITKTNTTYRFFLNLDERSFNPRETRGVIIGQILNYLYQINSVA